MPDSYKNVSYSFLTGFIYRYTDFFQYFNMSQECKRHVLELERRVIRTYEHPEYDYGTNSKYDQAELTLIFTSEVLRMSHRIAFNCFYSWEYDVFNLNIKPLANKGLLNYIRSFLINSLAIFNDFLEICKISVDGFFDGTHQLTDGNWLLIVLQQVAYLVQPSLFQDGPPRGLD